MSSVAVVSTKGGVGKSSITTHLAIAAAVTGEDVLVLDGDQAQNSIHVWAKALRDGGAPVIRKTSPETIERDLADATRQGFDYVFVDVPPGGGQLVTTISSLVEHILVPVRATTFDLHAMRNTVDLLRAAADNTEPRELAKRNALGKASIVLNAVPARVSASWMDDVKGALAQCGAGGLEIVGMLSDRAAYSAALANGHGVTEERDAKANAEIEDLLQTVLAMSRKRAKALKKAGATR